MRTALKWSVALGKTRQVAVDQRRRQPDAAGRGLGIELLEGRELLSGGACLPALASDVAEVAALSAKSAMKVVPNVAGTWDVHVTGSGIDLNGTVAMVQNGKQVTAQISLGGQSTDISGKIKKTSLKGKGTFDIPGVGTLSNVKYSFALLDPTNFSGTATASGVTINVVGVKQP